jgi:hypothetical protein
MLQALVAELEAEVQWHKVNSARRGEVEAVVLRRVQRMEAALQRVFTEVDLDAMDDNAELQRQLSTIARLARAALNPSQEPV